MKCLSRVRHLGTPRMRSLFRRSTILVGGVTLASVLLYLAVWIVTYDQRLAFRAAGTVFCGLLAVAILLFVLAEVAG